ncbi:lytic transglycosylase domain-containing protein [uncultured Planktomarina sp.]|uniref:lytic transglycosylase domain-containing protein n=1 Tax=uncultured Planktomarina sp. TaxID=1538529 RepID=UPI003261CAD4|tara:strand:- start:680 stop:2680 length:2001 start_codon:yes stop_codon:yes gene_type:complete
MKIFLSLLMSFFIGSPVVAQNAVASDALRAAYSAKEKGNWEEALRLVRPAGDVGVDLIEWDRLRAGKGEFAATTAFLTRRPDWPGLPYLRKRSEITIEADAPPNDVVAFFEGHPPGTAQGSLRLAQALTKQGQSKAALAAAQWGWSSFSMDEALEQEFQDSFGADLTSMHVARLDMLLWQGATSSAERMLPRVNSAQANLAKARLALQNNENGVTRLLANIPQSLKSDPGLAFDRFQWRLGRQQTQGAIEMLAAQSTSAITLGLPEKWAGRRMSLARDLLWDENYQSAYDLAANHHLDLGDDYAALEWLAGFIALRKLKKPKLALSHFKRHQSAVGSEISLGRTYYWQGRALKAMGQSEPAQMAFANGAKYQTSFYGLLAAEEAGLPMQAGLAGNVVDPDWRQADFVNSSVFKAGLLLISVERSRFGVRFLTHLAESQSPKGMAQLGGMAEELGIPYLELMLGKRASRYGTMMERHFYPLSPLLVQTDEVAPELALAIARRESEFFAGAVSGVGALGLMQVMPRTAKEMAGKLGLRYSRSKMLKDPKFNAKIGIRYLEELTEEFGNSPVHIAAAYNAGPSRARNWTDKLGDPRLGKVDVIDWIEQIPFNETRNYVMRVTESLPNYRARLAGQAVPLNFLAELKGNYTAPPAFAAPAMSMRPVSRSQ